MLQTLTPRGPDDSDVLFYSEQAVSLGHRRLSIIDLSASGRQPMSDPSGRFSITYNGEIYNYLELRQELKGYGYVFNTQTDTEVLLMAYRHWGQECLRRLRGMFAFAILDRGPEFGPAALEKNSTPGAPHLFLARDRFGIKPLLYTQTRNGFAFASELKALLAADLVDRAVRPEAVVEYLGYGAVSQPGTIVEGVFQLEPGTAMYVSKGGQRIDTLRYWDLAQASNRHRENLAGLDYPEQVRLIRTLLEDATRYHLIADVPVGAFLSGGVDSTAVCALMQRLTDKPVQTFSIGFQEAVEVTDESSFARQAAEFIGCEHKEVLLSGRDIQACFDAVITALDQPSIDGTNAYLVSQAASRKVKVAISGLGGDELFAGYTHFKAYQQAAGHKSTLLDHAAAFVHELRPSRFTNTRAHNAGDVQKRLTLIRNIANHKKLQKQVSAPLVPFCQPYVHPALLNGDLPDWDPVSQLSYAECKGYLKNTLLRDNDVMSMAHSLEVRPVLLDHKLAEHAVALPPEAKIRNGRLKAALVDSVQDLIPSECWQRPKKGFELPFASWMNGPLVDRFQEVFCSEGARQIFQESFRKKMFAYARKKAIPRKAWASFALLSWMEQSGCKLR
jgi:asparagine synthase (glutamine-hydrolysing)